MKTGPIMSRDYESRLRVAANQRARRELFSRIDFYVSPDAKAVIDGMRSHRLGGDASSILNRIVLEWASGIS